MPLSEAIYLAATDKIYGVMSNYILKFNATTGAKEASAKVCSPMYGPMRITGRASVLYVASADDLSMNRSLPDPVVSNRRIWNVDATTLAVTDVLGIDAIARNAYGFGTTYAMWGPRSMLFIGDTLYFQYSTNDGSCDFFTIDVTNPGTFNDGLNGGTANWTPETFSTDIANYIYSADSGSEEAELYLKALGVASNIGFSPTIPDPPNAIAYASNVGYAYSTCGNEFIYRHTDFALNLSVAHTLGPIAPNCAPCRIRYINGLLYMPCQKTDVVIVWNPITDTGIVKSGFDSPIDVIWTGTKLWAVQTGIQGLKEIV